MWDTLSHEKSPTAQLNEIWFQAVIDITNGQGYTMYTIKPSRNFPTYVYSNNVACLKTHYWNDVCE